MRSSVGNKGQAIKYRVKFIAWPLVVLNKYKSRDLYLICNNSLKSVPWKVKLNSFFQPKQCSERYLLPGFSIKSNLEAEFDCLVFNRLRFKRYFPKDEPSS